MSDLNKSSLTNIVNLIKKKKISSLEVTNHFIKKIENSSKLNSFITTCFEEAIKKAKEFDKKKKFQRFARWCTVSSQRFILHEKCQNYRRK